MNAIRPTPETGARPAARDFVQRSTLYQEFLAERDEILRHKWHLSEQTGRDVGFEHALLDWCRQHRDAWRAAHRARSRSRSPNRPLDPH